MTRYIFLAKIGTVLKFPHLIGWEILYFDSFINTASRLTPVGREVPMFWENTFKKRVICMNHSYRT